MSRFAHLACHAVTLNADHAARLGPDLAGLQPWRELGYTADGLTRYLSRTDPALTRWTLLHEEDAVAGVLCLREPWLRGPFVELLCILPPWQKRGLGRAWLEWLSLGTAERGMANLWTTATESNAPARKFYARCGFEMAGTLPNLIRPGANEILLRKDLRREPFLPPHAAGNQ
ncbi:MAG TPA: GNAT family N-acetyltransferase [Methylococcaceae bacterium]|nr:GNAT family N-acetyltransferase [Methylococcaceae bacterium]